MYKSKNTGVLPFLYFQQQMPICITSNPFKENAIQYFQACTQVSILVIHQLFNCVRELCELCHLLI